METTQKQDSNLNKLILIVFISLTFMTAQIIGGLMAHSIAIISDAIHLFSDVLSFSLSACAVWLSKKKAPKYFTFGYHKIQTLAAMANIITIWMVTGFLVYEASLRIINKQTVQKPKFMLLTSIFGLICNLTIMRVLDAEQQNHQNQNVLVNDFISIDEITPAFNKQSSSQKMKQSQSLEVKNNSKNVNIQAAYIHVLGDIILSVGVILSSCLIYLFSEQNSEWSYIHLADPACTFLFSIIIMFTTFGITKRSLIVLLDGCTEPQLVVEMNNYLSKNKNISKVEDFKMWSNGNIHFCTVKIQVNQLCKSVIQQEFARKNIDVTIQLLN